jgi:hypothetical protein
LFILTVWASALSALARTMPVVAEATSKALELGVTTAIAARIMLAADLMNFTLISFIRISI